MTVLQGMTWDHPRGKAPLVALGARSGSKGQTAVEWSARSLQAFADYPLDELASTYDLIIIDHPHVPLVAREDLLVPLDRDGERAQALQELAAQSVGASFASYTHTGHVWALPVDAAAQVAVCRPDLLSDLPRTWEDVVELARDGRVLWPTKPVDAMSSFLTLASQRGAEICGTPDRFIEHELGLTVLQAMHALSDRVPPACRQENPIETAERLATSDSWLYAPLAYGYVNYSRPGFRPHRLAYRDIPEGPKGVAGSCLGGAGIAVSAHARDRDAAIDVAFWLASAPLQAGEYYWRGGQPANALAWESPALNEDSWNFFAGTRATLEGASLRPRHARWMQMQEHLGDAVHSALCRELSDEACLDQLDAAWQRLVRAADTPGAGP